MQSWAFVSDFDGTITDDDFFVYTSNEFFDEAALAPWRDYLAGKITHFKALKSMYGSIRASHDEFHALINKMRVDNEAKETFKICQDRDIPIYIVSAGCDYYINYLIGDLIAEYYIRLLTNRSRYYEDQGLVMFEPDKTDEFYDEKTGVSKVKLIEKLKKEGYKVIFAGDGPPDVEAAKLADVVFARKILKDECEKQKIAYRELPDFSAIKDYILAQGR
ncbi:MAG: MtnX-like HAD-IB family phosphatase [Helicobacteraceae bacterium]|jgi:2,3-diketo-5-methylthio-1-phosphopentane phosphatase|nr:MtnX-like HAD-IB family phosphatase [Helicobacteraceae bacterium]